MSNEPFDPNVPSQSTLVGINVEVEATEDGIVPTKPLPENSEGSAKNVKTPTKEDLAGFSFCFDDESGPSPNNPQVDDESDN